jgi:hypothetical protein
MIMCSICNVNLSSKASQKEHDAAKKHQRLSNIIRNTNDIVVDLDSLYARVLPLLLKDPQVDVIQQSLSSLTKAFRKRGFGPACITCMTPFPSKSTLMDHLLSCHDCQEIFPSKEKLREHLRDTAGHTTHIYSKLHLKAQRDYVLKLVASLNQENPERLEQIRRIKVVFAAKFSLLTHIH